MFAGPLILKLALLTTLLTGFVLPALLLTTLAGFVLATLLTTLVLLATLLLLVLVIHMKINGWQTPSFLRVI